MLWRNTACSRRLLPRQNLKNHVSQHGRAIGIQSSVTLASDRSHSIHALSRRRWFSGEAQHNANVIETLNTPVQQFAAKSFIDGGQVDPKFTDIRKYLREWSVNHEKQLDAESPDTVRLARGFVLPSSFFVSDPSATGEQDEHASLLDHLNDSALGDEESYAEQDKALPLPGDVVLIQTPALKTQFGVFLGLVGSQANYVLADGRWFATAKSAWRCEYISGLIAKDDMTPVLPLLPTKPVTGQNGEGLSVFGIIPETIMRPFTVKLNELSKSVEFAQRQYGDAADRIYDALAHESEVVSCYIHEAAEKVWGIQWHDLSPGVKFVIREKLMSDERFDLRKVRVGLYLLLLPKEFQQAITKAKGWIRQYQDMAAQAAAGADVSVTLQKNPLAKFIRKARKLIGISRRIRQPQHYGLGPTPSSVHPPAALIERRATGEVFDEDQKTILTFLYTMFVLQPFAGGRAQSRSRASAALLLRAVGAYPGAELNDDTARQLLMEMGCLDHFFSPSQHHAAVPRSSLGLHATTIAAQKDMEQELAGVLDSDGNSTLVDTMAEYRKDWGDMEVFCIDSAATRVLDDGISLEPSTTHPGANWVHVHIAHVSAYIPPGTAIERYARVVGRTSYATRPPTAMLSPELVKGLSLQTGKRVLTTSTLIAEDGSVLDVRVQAGTVNNVICINAVQLEKEMKKRERFHSRLQVGVYDGELNLEQQEHSPDVTDLPRIFQHDPQQYLETLHKIQQITLSRSFARVREDTEANRMWMSATVVSRDLRTPGYQRSLEHWTRIHRSEHLIGDPTIKLYEGTLVSEPIRKGTYANTVGIVDGAADLCTESAAFWTDQHKIPACYTGFQCHPSFPMKKLNDLGPNDTFVKPSRGLSLKRMKNVDNSATGKLNFTNPLRDHRDLLNQYQVDAYIKAEAEAINTGTRLDLDTITYPFSRHDLEEYTEGVVLSTGVRMNDMIRFQEWQLMALHRAFHYNEAKLPDVWDLCVASPNIGVVRLVQQATRGQRVLSGYLMPLSMVVDVMESEEGWEQTALFRQFLPVKIIDVNHFKRVVQVVAVGPPSDSPRTPYGLCPELENYENEQNSTSAL